MAAVYRCAGWREIVRNTRESCDVMARNRTAAV
jgi:hypothetical protein